MKYEIIATFGPATEAEERLKALLQVGVTGFRLNTSHLSLEELQDWLEKLTNAFGAALAVPLVLDLQGSKWRLGQFRAFVRGPSTARNRSARRTGRSSGGPAA